VSANDGRARSRSILNSFDASRATRTAQRVVEPEIERPRENPSPVRVPKGDPFEREKDKRYKVDLHEKFKLKVALDPAEAATKSPHAISYLMFDNYFDYLCSPHLAPYGIPQLSSDEQVMYFWFYRMSYGYGYSACPMSDGELARRLQWTRKHLHPVRDSLLKKGAIRIEVDFPLFRNKRPQVYRVFLPREILENTFKRLQEENAQFPSDMPADVRAWIREFTA
jgi:hypothetical protein